MRLAAAMVDYGVCEAADSEKVWIVRGGVSRGSCFCSAAKWEAAYAEGSFCFGRKFVGWLEKCAG